MVQKAKEAALAEAKKEAKKEVKRIFDLEVAAKKQAKWILNLEAAAKKEVLKAKEEAAKKEEKWFVDLELAAQALKEKEEAMKEKLVKPKAQLLSNYHTAFINGTR